MCHIITQTFKLQETFGKFSFNCGSLYKQMTLCLRAEVRVNQHLSETNLNHDVILQREIYRKENQEKSKVRLAKTFNIGEQDKDSQ
jgi:hypothetical protein